MALLSPRPPRLAVFDPRDADDGFEELKAKVYGRRNTSKQRQGVVKQVRKEASRATPAPPVVTDAGPPSSSPTSRVLQRRIHAPQTKASDASKEIRSEINQLESIREEDSEGDSHASTRPRSASPPKPPRTVSPPKSAPHRKTPVKAPTAMLEQEQLSSEQTIEAPEVRKAPIECDAGSATKKQRKTGSARKSPDKAAVQTNTAPQDEDAIKSSATTLPLKDKAVDKPEVTPKQAASMLNAVLAEDVTMTDIDSAVVAEPIGDALDGQNNIGFDLDLEMNPDAFLNLDTPTVTPAKSQGKDSTKTGKQPTSPSPAAPSGSAPPFPRGDQHFKVPNDATPRTAQRLQKLEDERLGLSTADDEQMSDDVAITNIELQPKPSFRVGSTSRFTRASEANNAAPDTKPSSQKKVGFIDAPSSKLDTLPAAALNAGKASKSQAPLLNGNRRPLQSVLARPVAAADDDVFGFGGLASANVNGVKPAMGPVRQKPQREAVIATADKSAASPQKQSTPMQIEDSVDEMPEASQAMLQAAAEADTKTSTSVAVHDLQDSIESSESDVVMTDAKPTKPRNVVHVDLSDETFPDLPTKGPRSKAVAPRAKAKTPASRKKRAATTPAPRASKTTPLSGVKHAGSARCAHASSNGSSSKRTLELDPHSSPTAEQSRGSKVAKTPLSMLDDVPGKHKGVKALQVATNSTPAANGRAATPKQRARSRPAPLPKIKPTSKARIASSLPLTEREAPQTAETPPSQSESIPDPRVIDDFDFLPFEKPGTKKASSKRRLKAPFGASAMKKAASSAATKL